MLQTLMYKFSTIRKLPLLALVFLFTAFIINIILLVAGSKAGVMEYANMLTINTSSIGKMTVGPSAGKVLTRDISSIVNKAESAVSLSNTKGTANDKANAVTSNIATGLGIKDWYSYHLTTICEGTYSAGGKRKTTTSCSKPQPFFQFDPANKINQELKGKGKSLEDLGWPDTLSDIVKGGKTAFTIVSLLYVIGVILFVTGMLLAIMTMRSPGASLRMKAKAYTAYAPTAVLFLASAIQDFAIHKLVDIINAGGGIIDVHAYVGQPFIALTWTLTVISFVVMLLVLWERRRWYRGA